MFGAVQERDRKKLKYASLDCCVNANYVIGILRENKLHLAPRMSRRHTGTVSVSSWVELFARVCCDVSKHDAHYVDTVSGLKQMEPTLKHLVQHLAAIRIHECLYLILTVMNAVMLLQDERDAKRKAR